ncbi:EexN family lipoprotein [Lelliottia sp. V89_10]|uniref:EexN family lipoprotein n=1 Tax=Lelliottia wanjuensis TaxID=3050585 RepID=UPI00249E82A4|nr:MULTISPECIES: EexN family lipoprotein [unclassified Lelliottia]MDI3360319.1 EexN family lipoprotein [Lelliottia sp. V89_13]MDK9549455.1 EexN family lipoprotein [Lelliottia sp. V89_5]MDK9596130.1 EexN family lipoprotein [Lelliottia sp. V89_10]
MKALYCSFILGILFISGCNESPKTVEWYKEHPKEMNDTYTKCKASGDDTPDCRNAISAYRKLNRKSAPAPDFFGTDDVK